MTDVIAIAGKNDRIMEWIKEGTACGLSETLRKRAGPR